MDDHAEIVVCGCGAPARIRELHFELGGNQGWIGRPALAATASSTKCASKALSLPSLLQSMSGIR